jgi:hypothetical protein
VLAAFTTFGLVGLALIVVSLGLVFVAQEMPSRTAKGAALLGGLGALRSDLLSHPTNQMPPGRELGEISEVLPYAIVLGGCRPLAGRHRSRAMSMSIRTPMTSPGITDPRTGTCATLPDSMRNFRDRWCPGACSPGSR